VTRPSPRSPTFHPVPWGVPGPSPSSPWTSPAGPVLVAPMRRRDLRSVLRIDAQQAPQSWSVGLYLAELKRVRDRCYVVARVRPPGGDRAGTGRTAAGSAVVGFAGVLFQPPEAHITTIAVDSASRSRRIGTRLMLVLVRAAVAAGADSLTLEVRAGNAPAIALYRRFGLAPVGVRKGYYAELGEDALVMWGHDLRTEAYAARLAAMEARLEEPTITEGLDT
jgi:[ribosomal protein S18]-alanine N-acetyltransferase